jgi:SAM-dependent methyltransferase
MTVANDEDLLEESGMPAAGGGVTRSVAVSGQDHEQHWFEAVADHLGAAYLRYSFTMGTEQEVAFLVDTLDLRPGQRVLDVGCGPGRHAHALARRGIAVVGIDISSRFIDLARDNAPPSGATFRRLDARHLDYVAEFDAAISLCQGAFGLLQPDDDLVVLSGIARALRPAGRVAVSAFSAYYQVRYLPESDAFDAATGVHHERATVRDEQGGEADYDLWTTCYTPRELRLLMAAAGLEVADLWSVEPGRYERGAPTTETAEYLVIGTKPDSQRQP